MHHILIQALANQRITGMWAAAVSRRPPPSQPTETVFSSVRQRVGWRLVLVGLQLAIRRAGPDPTVVITQIKPLQMGVFPEAIRPRRRRAEQPSWVRNCASQPP
jgi:hypothetical protein